MDRLETADFGGNGLGGTFDVAGVAYDGSGNITALERRGGSGTLADDLTYTYGAGQSGRKSGRLTSISDPAGSLQGWDAASGSFSYDRAGRMTEAPAPYAISGARYDERSLPTKHVLSGSGGAPGDTVRYRYSLAGERTYQRSGSGVPTRYLLGAGGANLGTIEGSSLESWNLALPSGSAIGRVTASGERRYYLKGHLGSVRTAIDASGVAKEARDYYPFGLRLRAGGEMAAEEDFTGHHLDAATGGLLYAGARYYMPALGRWGSPDPLLEERTPGQLLKKDYRYLAQSPYNYVHGNPLYYVDPDGKQVAAEVYQRAQLESRTGADISAGARPGGTRSISTATKRTTAEVGIGFIPVVGELGDGFELLTGYTTTGRVGSRLAAAAGLMLPFVGAAMFRGASKLAKASIGDLVAVGNRMDRNGLTYAGRALQKHGDRAGSAFPEVSSHKELNARGAEVLEGILRSDDQIVDKLDSGGRVVFDSNTGRGVAFTEDGSFNGFRELSQRGN